MSPPNLSVPRWPIVAVVALGLFASATGNSHGDQAAQDCYAKVGPLLVQSGGKLSPEVRAAYVDWAESSALRDLKQHGKSIPEDCLSEVGKDPNLRQAMFAAVYPPDPSVIQNYARLRADLGSKFMSRYRSLVVAVSVAKRTKGVEESPTTSKDIGRDYQPGFWADETMHSAGSDAESQLIHVYADFLESKGVAAADLYTDENLQHQLIAFLKARNVPASYIADTRRYPQFGDRLKDAMVLLGQRPGARQPKPPTETWLRYLASVYEASPSSTPTGMSWPLFPLTEAPWPMLMPLAHPVPVDEAKYIWEAFQGQHGDDRYHTYGPYRNDDDAMPYELKPSHWFWDAWPDRTQWGGECVPISKGTVDFYSSLGKPAMWAGQPGHANLISFQYVGGTWMAEVEQAFAGGPDVTFAQWYFDEEPGTELRYRSLYYWAGAEYQLGLALAMNLGIESYMDTRIAANIFRVLPEDQKQTVGVELLTDVLQANPFNPEIWYRLGTVQSDPAKCIVLAEAALKRDPGSLLDRPNRTILQKFLDAGHPDPVTNAMNQYWQTLTEFSAQYAILEHNAPKREADLRKTYEFLLKIPGIQPDSLADYMDEASGNSPKDALQDDVNLDQSLAAKGDAFGSLRMGLRYRDGDGVPESESSAKEFLTKAAALEDPAAAVALDRLSPYAHADNLTVTASSTASDDQNVQHLIDGTGMMGALHDNQREARSMWHSKGLEMSSSPGPGLPVSPAWVRFDFKETLKFDSIQIWNLNQLNLTDRGFQRARIYGTTDGSRWFKLTDANIIEIPRAAGTGFTAAYAVRNVAASTPITSVIIAAEAVGGNYGGSCYGLSAVHFATSPIVPVIPADEITVTASSFRPDQSPQHLIDDSGMFGSYHDNNHSAFSMWHTDGSVPKSPPAEGLPLAPAWVRFDFARPHLLDKLIVWNLNQENLTERGFRWTHVYGTTDGKTWFRLTDQDKIEFPRATGEAFYWPFNVPVTSGDRPIKSVILAADSADGGYCIGTYGLSAVRFGVHY
jgi:hypothetical protein